MKCRKCEREKREIDFYRNADLIRLQPCKECRRAYQREYEKRPGRRERQRVYQREYARARYHALKAERIADLNMLEEECGKY